MMFLLHGLLCRKIIYIFIYFSILVYLINADCVIPNILKGSWFSWESGQKTITEIDGTTMTNRGTCVNVVQHGSDYTLVFENRNEGCYHCVKTFPRTLNVFEKYEGTYIYSHVLFWNVSIICIFYR